ncbi:MAG TPA: DUF6600 domain-containing protein, partial [Pyrinomonadaceae bacterium]|nr:DUF6600 domain-containing protein [Pyrinomonadaceae bacterium]
MFAVKRPLFSLAFLLLLVCVGSISALAATPAQRINIPDNGAVIDDDDKPEVTDRVARVSFLEGTAKVRRDGSQDWEAVTLNLPLVEGDEIATENGAKVEIQFAKNQHVRIAEESSLKIVTLRDDGIALSLTTGTLVTHVDSFDKAKGFFEIDAPKTTVALEKAGTFRVDAGRSTDSDVRVAATDGGEARVYSDMSGFTLKNGRSTRIAIAGANAGEWQTTDANDLRDAFDAWASGRDLAIAQRIKQAYYDKYYDDDIYGADDLNDYGQWVHTSKYGWVWRPDRSAISTYVDWSPYRYGHWRWMPPFGWVWVNDEPWGWATYHHGRWVYDAGYWYWSPYGYYRPSHSWWYPALVAISHIDINITWYPIGYHDRCRWDYWGHNRGHGGHGGGWDNGRGGRGGGNNGGGNPPPGPVGGRKPPTFDGGPTGLRNPPVRGGGGRQVPPPMPPEAVVGTTADEFVAGRHPRPLPPEKAKEALENENSNDQLNAITSQVAQKVPVSYRAMPPTREITPERISVGASTRIAGAPLDDDLEKKRVFGGRTPKPVQRDATPQASGGAPPSEVERPTGAIERPQRPHREADGGPVRVTTPPESGDVDVKDHGRGGIRAMPPETDGTRPKVEPGADPRPGPEPRSEPRVTPVDREPRSEPKSEPRTQPRPEPRSEPRSEPRPQPLPQPRPEPTK